MKKGLGKFLAITALVAAIGFSAAGCGGSGWDGDAPPPPPPPGDNGAGGTHRDTPPRDIPPTAEMIVDES